MEITTGRDGSVPDLAGRRGWVRMQTRSGARFDARSDRIEVWRRRGAQVVPNYPVHFDRSARAAEPAGTYPEISVNAGADSAAHGSGNSDGSTRKGRREQ